VAGGARGVINALGNLGGFVGPYLVGLLVQTYNFNVGIYSLVFSLILAVLLTVSLPKETTAVKNNLETADV
jgi:nitrate/nitrite transporter NarK